MDKDDPYDEDDECSGYYNKEYDEEQDNLLLDFSLKVHLGLRCTSLVVVKFDSMVDFAKASKMVSLGLCRGLLSPMIVSPIATQIHYRFGMVIP